MLRAEFRLPSITDEEAAPERKAPIRVKFEIPYFTVSGIQVLLNVPMFFLIFGISVIPISRIMYLSWLPALFVCWCLTCHFHVFHGAEIIL